VSYADEKITSVKLLNLVVEAWHKALADDTTEILWIHSLISEIRLSFVSIITLWCDNLDTTYLSVNLIFYVRTKFVEVNYHFIHDRVAK
jgi:hypothetical protein